MNPGALLNAIHLLLWFVLKFFDSLKSAFRELSYGPCYAPCCWCGQIWACLDIWMSRFGRDC